MGISKLDFGDLMQSLPRRPNSAHKGDFGHVLIIGGDSGYPGAPVLAALGALRVGAGLVTIASHEENLVGLNAAHPEIMCHAIDDVYALTQVLAKASVVVLGPGLGRKEWGQDVYTLASQTELPIVVDADALYFLAQHPTQNKQRVITPHPGEAGRLLKQLHAVSILERDDGIRRLITKYDCTVVLKGNGTLVGSPDKPLGICTAGNPGMSVAGMGDLLSGVIGGLIAQGLDLDTAAKLGVCVHAKAGDLAAKDGQRGTIATDLLLPLKHLME